MSILAQTGTGPIVWVLAGLFVPLFGQFVLQLLEYRWRRSELAARYLSEWTDQTRDLRHKIEARFGRIHSGTEPINLDPDELRQIVTASEGEEGFEVRESLIGLMNWFQEVVELYTRRMVSRSFVDQTFRPPMVLYFRKIRPLVRAFNDYVVGNGGRPWGIVEDELERWDAQMEKRSAKYWWNA